MEEWMIISLMSALLLQLGISGDILWCPSLGYGHVLSAACINTPVSPSCYSRQCFLTLWFNTLLARYPQIANPCFFVILFSRTLVRWHLEFINSIRNTRRMWSHVLHFSVARSKQLPSMPVRNRSILQEWLLCHNDLTLKHKWLIYTKDIS